MFVCSGVASRALFTRMPLILRGSVTVRSVTRTVAMVGGVRVDSNGWSIVRFYRFDINIRQPVVAMTIVTVERERLEFLEDSTESLAGWSLVVRESELVPSGRRYAVPFVISRAQTG